MSARACRRHAPDTRAYPHKQYEKGVFSNFLRVIEPYLLGARDRTGFRSELQHTYVLCHLHICERCAVACPQEIWPKSQNTIKQTPELSVKYLND